MPISRFIAPLAAAVVAVLMLGQAAHADLLIDVDKSAQRMTVTLNGEQLYQWPVSTGGQGYDTPSGTFKPFRMEIDHYSEEYESFPPASNMVAAGSSHIAARAFATPALCKELLGMTCPFRKFYPALIRFVG